MDLSIVIPLLNEEESLPELCAWIQRVMQDNKYNYEIILIDDGSTDETAAWLKTQTDLVVLSQNNQGKDWAVNRGFSIAKGKYIRFLDSDD